MGGESERDFIVHPEFECKLGGGELKAASSVVTQLCYHGSEECERDVYCDQTTFESQFEIVFRKSVSKIG